MRADLGRPPLGSSLRAQANITISPFNTCDIRLSLASDDFNKYPAKQHARRVAAKLGTSTGLIYLIGQPTVNLEDSDQERPFRQRRYFYYLSGVDEADCHLTYDIESDRLTLYVPNFDLHNAIWMGPTLTVEQAQTRYDVDQASYFASLEGDIKTWMAKHNQSSSIYILHETHKPKINSNDDLQLNASLLQPAMNTARGVKDDYEIQLIRHANKISGLAHRKILEGIRKMTMESEIEGSFLNTCVSLGAKNQAYNIIAGSGENAATLHYSKNNEPLTGRQLLCLDGGAEWNCYASDVTRTIPLTQTGTWPSVQARDIYHIVEAMQEECIKRIKVGVRYLDLHVLAHVIAIKGLLHLGILRNGTEEEIRKSGASTVFFPHGLGHHVGLEVHDVSGQSLTALHEDEHYNALLVPSTSHSPCTLSASYLEAGMIVTVEPGLYFSRLAIANARQQSYAKYINFDLAEQYIPVGGVRIEDDILVTSTGYENLTTAPKGSEMLEIIRRGIDN